MFECQFWLSYDLYSLSLCEFILLQFWTVELPFGEIQFFHMSDFQISPYRRQSCIDRTIYKMFEFHCVSPYYLYFVFFKSVNFQIHVSIDCTSIVQFMKYLNLNVRMLEIELYKFRTTEFSFFKKEFEGSS